MIDDLLALDDASKWASKYLGKKITKSNISYLVQYGRIQNKSKSGNIRVSIGELKNYYQFEERRIEEWKKELGEDLNWNLSFDHLQEKERTKHVHRLHPYKGKFIPQLVRYFLEDHVNKFKTKVFFKKGDIILDPFMGSGTTLVECSELGLHSIGIDISEFNCMIAYAKIDRYDMRELYDVLFTSLSKTKRFSKNAFSDHVNGELKNNMHSFNHMFFPSPEYKIKVRTGEINEEEYSNRYLREFLFENEYLLENKKIREKSSLFDNKEITPFLDKWFSDRAKEELFFYKNLIEKVENKNIKNLMKIILSRTARSCRATTHYDLATLKKPQYGPYYCKKHYKICTPTDSTLEHLDRYTRDTIERIKKFSELRKNVESIVILGDSRKVDIFKEIKERKKRSFQELFGRERLDGVFTSPPYIGQIDYHEQHAYAYELYNIERRDNEEIGPQFRGKSKSAQEEYIRGISNTLENVTRFIKDDGDLFIVANDKLNLYPKIAKISGLRIIQTFKRPVLNRTENDKNPYDETIFHMIKDKIY